MGHGSRLCFLSGLAGVARARCRVECGDLRSFINGKLLKVSDFAGGGIMAGSRPVAILARSVIRGNGGGIHRADPPSQAEDRPNAVVVQLAIVDPSSWLGSLTSFEILAVTVTPSRP